MRAVGQKDCTACCNITGVSHEQVRVRSLIGSLHGPIEQNMRASAALATRGKQLTAEQRQKMDDAMARAAAVIRQVDATGQAPVLSRRWGNDRIDFDFDLHARIGKPGLQHGGGGADLAESPAQLGPGGREVPRVWQDVSHSHHILE